MLFDIFNKIIYEIFYKIIEWKKKKKKKFLKNILIIISWNIYIFSWNNTN